MISSASRFIRVMLWVVNGGQRCPHSLPRGPLEVVGSTEVGVVAGIPRPDQSGIGRRVAVGRTGIGGLVSPVACYRSKIGTLGLALPFPLPPPPPPTPHIDGTRTRTRHISVLVPVRGGLGNRYRLVITITRPSVLPLLRTDTSPRP